MKLPTVSLAILMMIGLPTPDAHAQGDGKWVKLAPFPEAGEEVYGIAAGGKLYVFGGLAPVWKPRALVYEYDPASDKWTKKKPMALPSHHLALAELNGKIYVIGGASTHPGSKETAVHPARPHRSVAANEVYDPATNSWETRSPMPTARNHAAVGVVNNKINVIGGRIGAAFMAVPASNTDIVEEYDPATDQWGGLKAPMPTPRSAFAWGTYRSRIYVAGGEMRNAQSYGTYRAVEAYDPAANRWSILPPMQVPRHGLAGDVIGNRLHLVSGDVQSLGAIELRDVHVHTDLHDAFEFADR